MPQKLSGQKYPRHRHARKILEADPDQNLQGFTDQGARDHEDDTCQKEIAPYLRQSESMSSPDLKLIQNESPLCDVVEILDENSTIIPFESLMSLPTGKTFFLITRLQPTLEDTHHAIRNLQTNELRRIEIDWTHGLANDMEGSDFRFV